MIKLYLEVKKRPAGALWADKIAFMLNFGHQMVPPGRGPGGRGHEAWMHPRLAREAQGRRCSNILIDIYIYI